MKKVERIELNQELIENLLDVNYTVSGSLDDLKFILSENMINLTVTELITIRDSATKITEQLEKINDQIVDMIDNY